MSARFRLTEATVSNALGSWISSTESLGASLTKALRQCIATGELPPYGVLPSERQLAQQLSVSRTTVGFAYDRLREEGWLSSQQGSGTWVRDLSSRSLVEPVGVRLKNLGELLPETVVNLTTASPPGLPMLNVALKELQQDELDLLLATPGYAANGLPPLLVLFQEYLADYQVQSRVSELLITNGSQHALNLITEAMMRPSDVVIVEEPTYRGALDIFEHAKVKMVSCVSGADGINIDALETAGRQNPGAFLYLLPDVHNPTGSVLPKQSMADVASIIKRHDLTLIEDASPIDTYFGKEPISMLCSHLPKDRFVAFGSSSKLFWGGLRVGWIHASEEWIFRIGQLRAQQDLGGSILSQLLLTKLLPRREEARSLRRDQLGASWSHLGGLIDALLPEWSYFQPVGGASLWVTLPLPMSSAFTTAVARKGVRLTSGPTFSATSGCKDKLRISYANSPAERTKGLTIMAGVWNEFFSQ